MAALEERLRHQQTINRMAQQMEHLAANPSFHIHLEPLKDYRELVRNRLFAQPATK